MTWTSKYGYVMMDFFGSGHPVDGMNEEGLSMGFLYLPGYTKYQTVPKGANSDALIYLYVGDWVLGNFKTVEEVKKAIKDVYVFSKPVTYGDIKNVVFPVHLTVSDKSGKSIVVEWVDGKMNVYDNPLGVLTNSPELPWHLDNLKNYVNISPHSPAPLELDGIEYTATGQGSGATGIPGDFTPPSGFVKTMYLVKSCFPVETGEETVNLADHIMNNVDIPIGAVQGEKGAKDDLPDRTQWTVFKDLTNNKLYFKSYENTTLQVIDLNKVDFAMGAKVLDIPLHSKQIFVDATDRFLQSSSEK
jgi:choloylglycine hydrolase